MTPAASPTADLSTDRTRIHPWVARLGLMLAMGILVSCFGLLIAASHAAQ